jgi:hypothetical protein
MTVRNEVVLKIHESAKYNKPVFVPQQILVKAEKNSSGKFLHRIACMVFAKFQLFSKTIFEVNRPRFFEKFRRTRN